MTSRFVSRKLKILEQLEAPGDEYHDLSPKGSVDIPIRALIDDINKLEGLVTTSSCSGRISVFLEGRKADANQPEPLELSIAGPGGKGGGGVWLFISHDPVPAHNESGTSLLATFGLKLSESSDRRPGVSSRYIHLKFEPMILHILTASLGDSQRVLTAALGSGFRESGAVSLNPSKSGELNPIVAVRSTGYSFDSIIGHQSDTGQIVSLVDESCLRTLVEIANERFNINSERIARFQAALLEQYTPKTVSAADAQMPVWEDAEIRKQRKRDEGLARQRAMKEKAQGIDAERNMYDQTNLGEIFDS